jgi:hypothetical protein
LTDVSEVRAASIIRTISLIIEAARTSETSIDNYFTRQYIQENKSEIISLIPKNGKQACKITSLSKCSANKV